MAWSLYGLHVNTSHFEQLFICLCFIFFPKVVAYDVNKWKWKKQPGIYVTIAPFCECAGFIWTDCHHSGSWAGRGVIICTCVTFDCSFYKLKVKSGKRNVLVSWFSIVTCCGLLFYFFKCCYFLHSYEQIVDVFLHTVGWQWSQCVFVSCFLRYRLASLWKCTRQVASGKCWSWIYTKMVIF